MVEKKCSENFCCINSLFNQKIEEFAEKTEEFEYSFSDHITKICSYFEMQISHATSLTVFNAILFFLNLILTGIVLIHRG